MKLADLKKGYVDMNAGVWVGDIPLPLFDGIRLKVRRLWNPDYVALHDKLDIPGADPATVTIECLVSACLIDWDGVDDPFSVDAARTMLSDVDIGPVFRSALLYAGQHVADRVKADIEADAKNSLTP